MLNGLEMSLRNMHAITASIDLLVYILSFEKEHTEVGLLSYLTRVRGRCPGLLLCLKGHTMQHSGHTAKKNQNEFMVEIYAKSLVRAIGKVLCMKSC